MFKKSPDALVIIIIVLVFAVVLTWLVPAGSFDRTVIEEHEVVVAGTYKPTEANPQGIGDLLTAPIRGFIGASQIIAFVLFVGGAFSMLTATGALDAGLHSLVRFAGRRPDARKWVIPMLMVFFSLAGCTFGMSEENLVFVMITIPLARSLGYDNVVGVAIPFLGSAAGFAGAAINPFTVGIAQGIAELPVGSGAGYRWFVWCIFTAIAIIFVMRYVRRLERNPQSSLLHGKDQGQWSSESLEAKFTTRHLIITALFVASIGLLMYGSGWLDWYINEIAALFVVLGIVSAFIGRIGITKAIGAFKRGASDMLTAGIIIAISRAVLVVAEEGRIIDTMLHAMAGLVDELPRAVTVQGMFVVQGLINVFVPSGSGQAAITMPIMTPLADLLGISRQTAVLAFQFGDGLLNIIIPTSAVTMGILSIGQIPFGTWVRWVWKLVAISALASMVLLAVAEFYPVW